MKKIFSFLLLGLVLSIGNAWADLSKASSIAAGDQVAFVCESAKAELTGIDATKKYGLKTNYQTSPAGTLLFDVVAGSTNGTFAFKNGDNYLVWNSGNSLEFSTTLNANSSWTVSFSNGNAIILNAANTARKLRYNSTSPRFACYTSDQTAIQLYKVVAGDVCATPNISGDETFYESTEISIACVTDDASIYYTLDGNVPTSSSLPYSAPFSITATTTVKAIAVKDGLGNSEVASQTFTLVPLMTVAQARAAIDAQTGTQGAYAKGVVSSIVTAYDSGFKNITFNFVDQAGDEAFLQAYRCLGAEAANVAVGDTVIVTGNLTKYNTTYEFGQGCQIVSLKHPVVTVCENPTFSVPAGEYNEAKSVELACETEGATIRYTTDGTDPTAQSAVYSAAIAVNQTMTIKAIAMKDGLDNSEIVSATYTIVLIPAIVAESTLNLAYDATSGEIAYSVTNPTAANLTAVSSTDWISNIVVTADKVTFATTANDGDLDREGFITLSYTGAENKVITITQAHFVVDYATLPFEWAGGASESLLALDGVTADGLGGDYGVANHNPYLVKLDGTGDYIQVKTDSQPAKVTIGVKMIGGANTSYIKVQESADGVNFTEVQNLTISGAQNDILEIATTNAFAETTRFVKMVFTKGSNVGVGPISIAAVTNDPSVVVEETSINVPYTGALDGVINVTYNNITQIVADVAFFESDGTTPLAQEPDWIVADIDNQTHNLVYVVDINEGIARTAYLKVYALDDESNEVYSELITITQAACAYAILPFFFNDGRADIENTPGLTQEGLGSDYGSSPKLRFDHTGDEMILRINENAGVLSFDIKGNSFEGGTFSVQVSNDGSEYSNLDEFTALATTANMAYSLAAGVRYIKWIYTEKDNGNVALGNIKVRKPAEASITLGTNGWSTYAIDYTCKLSGAEVYKAAYNEQQNAVVLTEVENAVVPAGEGIILKGTEGASVTIIPSNAEADDFTDNELVGVLSPIEAEANYYVLATIDQDGITKFHPCYAGITIPANKAFIEIGEATAPSAIRIEFAENNATDIQNVEGAEKAVKFMENGKLYIQKNGVVYDAMGKTVR